MGPTNAQEFRYQLDADAEIYAVLYTANGQPTGYSVVLLAVLEGGEARTVRVYDDHEIGPHLHRFDKQGIKGPREKISLSITGEGFTMALEEIRNGYREMIDSWQR
jgi:hypothetical protein